MLDRVVIQGFKSIKELDLPLSNLNVLIGANGSGKSNFLSFFRFMREFSDGNLDWYVTKSAGANKFFHFGVKNTPAIQTELYFSDDPRKKQMRSFGSTAGDKIVCSRFGDDLNESQADFAKYDDWVVYHFNDTSPEAKIKRTNDINNNEWFRYDGSNLAAYLYMLKEVHPESYTDIVETIQLVAPFFKDFNLRPIQENKQTILLEWTHKQSPDLYFKISDFSDGLLRFICLATVLLQPNPPNLIIIDEPELGLHHYAISILASLIRKISKRHQVIISTQSVTLVDEFSADNIITVNMTDGASTFERQSEEELKDWLKDYSLGELWEKNVLGGRP
jgi:predicted ATPase